MPDIAMCLNPTCPHRERCYRFTARPSQPYQWYAEHAPGEDGVCVFFLEATATRTDAKAAEALHYLATRVPAASDDPGGF
jgi:hypothetical protein